MSDTEKTETKISLPQAKRELLLIGEENLDQFQRRTLDYLQKFSKIEEAAAPTLVERLVNEFGLDDDEAVQVINCAPESVDELRIFLAGGKKIIEATKLDAIIALLNENRVIRQ